jgi:hypothetical protein
MSNGFWKRLLDGFKVLGAWPAESLSTRRRLVPVSKRRMRLPDYDTDGWCLADAEDIHRDHPETFYLPDLAERQNLQPGDFVQLIFEIDNDDGPDERMWAIVREIVAGGYIGMLNNEPATITENDTLWVGTEFAFEYRHIIDCSPSNAGSRALASAPPPIPWRQG